MEPSKFATQEESKFISIYGDTNTLQPEMLKEYGITLNNPSTTQKIKQSNSSKKFLGLMGFRFNETNELEYSLSSNSKSKIILKY